MRDADASEHDMIAVAESVHVEAVAGADVGKRRHAQGFGANEIVVGRKLHIGSLASENSDTMAGPFGERGVVGKVLAAGRRRATMRVDDQIKGKRLRCLHDAQPTAIERFDDALVLIDFFTVSATERQEPPRGVLPPAAIARVISAPVRNGRAASWMSTKSGCRRRGAPRARREPKPAVWRRPKPADRLWRPAVAARNASASSRDE